MCIVACRHKHIIYEGIPVNFQESEHYSRIKIAFQYNKIILLCQYPRQLNLVFPLMVVTPVSEIAQTDHVECILSEVRLEYCLWILILNILQYPKISYNTLLLYLYIQIQGPDW